MCPHIFFFQKGVPLFCGSSYKNIGVQALMDGILDYLPSPNERTTLDPFKCFGTSMSARAFKIVHEKQKGPVTFLRVYSGTLEKVKLVKINNLIL